MGDYSKSEVSFSSVVKFGVAATAMSAAVAYVVSAGDLAPALGGAALLFGFGGLVLVRGGYGYVRNRHPMTGSLALGGLAVSQAGYFLGPVGASLSLAAILSIVVLSGLSVRKRALRP